MFRLLCVVIVVGLVGCFDPVVPAGLRCDSEVQGSCPEGQICDTTQRCCRPIGGTCGSPDQAAPSQADLLPVSGCAFGGGFELSPGLWACKGIWESGKASTLCRVRLAQANEVSAAAAAQCATLPGFYVVAGQVWPADPKNGTCQPPELQSCSSVAPVTFTYRLGCGGARTAKNYRDCAVKCGALSQAILCFGPSTGYACTSNSLDDRNADPSYGVLCVG